MRNISIWSILCTNRINLSLLSPPTAPLPPPPKKKEKKSKTNKQKKPPNPAIVVVYFPETKHEECGSVWANFVQWKIITIDI